MNQNPLLTENMNRLLSLMNQKSIPVRFDGSRCWCDGFSFQTRTVRDLEAHGLISATAVKRWDITEEGKKVLANPRYQPTALKTKVHRLVSRGQA
jgi:hypothetical protein